MLGIWQCLKQRSDEGAKGPSALQIFARQPGHFVRGRGKLYWMYFRAGGREADWSLIKILIPTLPIFLPSQQPAFLFVVLGILL